MTDKLLVVHRNLFDFAPSQRSKELNDYNNLHQDDLKSLNGTLRINPGKFNSYNIELVKLINSPHTVIHDGSSIIADVVFEEGKLVIKSHTDKQLNLLDNINCDEILFDTKGAIVVDGVLTANIIIINASHIAINKPIIARDILTCNSKIQLQINSDIKSSNIKLKAPVLIQSSEIRTTNRLDIEVVVYKQEDSAIIVTDGLEILAEQAQLLGNISVTGVSDSSFIVANEIFFGDLNTETTVQIKGEHYIHVGTMRLSDNTQLVIDGGDENKCQVIIDDGLNIHRNASFDIKYTDIATNHVIVNGELTSENSKIQTYDLYQEGILDCHNTILKIENDYIQSDASTSNFKNTKVNVNKINLAGDFKADKSSFNCYDFVSFSSDLNILDCKIEVQNFIRLIKGANLGANSSIESDNIYMSGNCKIDGLYVRAKQKIDFDFSSQDSLSCYNSVLCTNILKICSSDSELKNIFTNSSLNFDVLIQKGKIRFIKSLLTSINDNLSHNISGYIDLDMTSCSLANQIYISKNGKLTINNSATLRTKRIWNQGQVYAIDSRISAEELLEQGEVLSAEKSHIHVAKSAVISGKDILLNSSSKLQAVNIYQSKGNIRLKGNSYLSAVELLLTNKLTCTDAEESTVNANKILTLGEFNLKNSLLVTEDLAIYNDFRVTDNSKLHARNEIQLVNFADARIHQSILSSKRVVIHGRLSLLDTVVNAEKSIISGSTSNIKLANSSHLLSNQDINLHGILDVASANGLTPSIRAKDHLQIAQSAVVSGNSLVTDSQTFIQDGELKLDGDFISKGNVLHNTGSTSARNMMLGFDDSVYNTGSLNADTVTIHSNFFNLLGYVNAKKAITTAGIFNCNAGFISANNSNHDSLFSFNAGINLPNIYSDVSDILSTRNLVQVGRSLLTNTLPQWTSTVNLAFMLPSLYNTASAVLDINNNWSKIYQMRKHEIMPLVCQIKSSAMLGLSAYNSIYASFGEFSDLDYHRILNSVSDNSLALTYTSILNADYSKFFNKIKSDTISLPWQDYALNSVSILGGNYTNYSLLHLNTGTNIAVINNFSNFGHFNLGVESAFSQQVDTGLLYNAGISRGAQATYKAKYIYNSGYIEGNRRLFVEADAVNNREGAEIHGSNAVINVKRFNQKGKLHISNGFLNINDFQDGIRAHTDLKDSVYSGENLVVKGNLNLESVYAKVNNVHFNQDSTVVITNTTILSDKFNDESSLSIIGQNLIETKDYKHSGKISLQVVPAEVNTESKNINMFAVKSEIATLDGEANIDSAIFDVDHFTEATDFIAGNGKYSNYKFALDLGFTTKDSLDLTTVINRDANIYLTANDIVFSGKYNWDKTLSLTSTNSNIHVTGNINAREFYGNSAGDFVNNGGIIKATDYAQILSAGDVLNICNERTFKGRYDTQKTFDAAIISGGIGSQTNGIGLHINAKGKVIGDASIFASDGSNYIHADKGVEFKARSHTFVSKDETKKTHLGFSKKHKVETSTTIGACSVQSTHGRNIVDSGDEVKSVATLFSAAGGTDIYADNEVKLFSLKTHSSSKTSKSSFWGLTYNKRKQMDESATPTLFLDNGLTRVHSNHSNVDARGALFLGLDDLEIKADKKIKLGCDILNHTRKQEIMSLGLSSFGVNAWNTYSSSQSAWTALATADPFLGKVDQFLASNNNTEYLSNGANLAISGLNTANTILSAYKEGNLLGAIESRYGLGGAGGFDPTVNVSLTHTKTNEKFQSLGPGGIDRGNVKLEAGDSVDLENGVQIHGRNIDVNAPQLNLNAAKLQSSSTKTTQSVQVGVTASGNVVDMGGSSSSHHTKSISYINAGITASENLHLHNGEGIININLDGGNLNCQTLDANIGRLDIIDKQNIVTSSSTSVSASASGQVTGYHGQGREIKVEQNSGIFVQDGINTNGHSVHVNTASMVGGKITTDGENKIQIDELTATQLHDENKYIGFGVGLNVNDIVSLSEKDPKTTSIGMVDVATVNVDYTDYKAVRAPVLFGALASMADIRQQNGKVITDSENGVVIIRDINQHLSIDVPLATKEAVEKIQENISHLVDDLKQQVSVDTANIIDAIVQDSDKLPIEPSLSIIGSEQEVAKALEVIKKIDENNPVIDSEQEQAVLKALYVLTQELASKQSGKILEGLGESSQVLKAYFKSKAKFSEGIFSFLGESLDHPDSTVSKKVEDTAVKLTKSAIFDKLITSIFGKLGGVVSTGMTALEVLDLLTYNQKVVDQKIKIADDFVKSSEELRKDMQSHKEPKIFKNFLTYWGMIQEAADQRSAAALMQSVHGAISYKP